AHAAGAVDVVVTTSRGSATLAGGFTYIAPIPVPVISGLTPNSGGIAGGTAVTLTGTDFTGASEVTFGGVPGTALNVVDATTISVTTPAHAAGSVDVIVTTLAGPGTLPAGFSYVAPAGLVLSPSGGALTEAMAGEDYSQAIA